MKIITIGKQEFPPQSIRVWYTFRNGFTFGYSRNYDLVGKPWETYFKFVGITLFIGW